MKQIVKFVLILLFVSFASWIVLLSYKPYLGIDDAYIYFVYAKNLASNHGFVYNVGGERVEGFTSMLWVLICSVAYRWFTETHFRQALMVLNIGMISFALFRLTDFIDRRFVGKTTAFPSIFSLCLLSILFVIKGYLDWVVLSLLETGLWSSCLMLIVIHLLESCYSSPDRTKPFVFGLLLMILALTRPESLLLGVVFLILRLLIYWQKKQSFFPALQTLIIPAIFFIVTFSGLVVFRLYYFGYPFPNTFYAKVSSNHIDNIKEGTMYLSKFLFVYPVYWLPVILVLATFWIRLRLLFAGWRIFLTFRNDELAQTCVALVSFIAFILPMGVGGDHFSLFRMYQPFAPIFLLLLFNKDFIRKSFFDTESKKPSGGALPRLAWVVLLLPVFYLMNIPKYFVDSNFVPYKVSLLLDFSMAQSYRQVSVELDNFFPFYPKPSIGRIAAGGYAFGYDGSIVDLMGLNNTLMAHANGVKVGVKDHASFDKATFYKLHPDFVEGEFVGADGQFELPENRPDFDTTNYESILLKGIFRDSAFMHLYQPVLIGHQGSKDVFFTYARTDYIDTLRGKSYLVTPLQRKEEHFSALISGPRKSD